MGWVVSRVAEASCAQILSAKTWTALNPAAARLVIMRLAWSQPAQPHVGTGLGFDKAASSKWKACFVTLSAYSIKATISESNFSEFALQRV